MRRTRPRPAQGGWIPASKEVTREPAFQDYLQRYPLFATFVDLADSPNQVPTPAIPGVNTSKTK